MQSTNRPLTPNTCPDARHDQGGATTLVLWPSSRRPTMDVREECFATNGSG
jgi:hypothetical protein